MTVADRMPNGYPYPVGPLTVIAVASNRSTFGNGVKPCTRYQVLDANGRSVATCRTAADAAAYVRMATRPAGVTR